MISAVTFVLGGLAILSTMGPLHFVLAEYPRHPYQQCLDEGFVGHCLFEAPASYKYMCKKLVCAQNEGGIMIAMDTGKLPDEGSPCNASEGPDGRLKVTKTCQNGYCRLARNRQSLKFSGMAGQGLLCWTRRGELFTGGTAYRAEKCPNRP